MIYFIQCGTNGPIKIGYTDNDVQSRLNQLQTACPYELKLLWYCQGNQSYESEIHECLSHERIRGEWFRPGKSVLDFIDDDATNNWEIKTTDEADGLSITESRKEIDITAGGWGITHQKDDIELILTADGYYKIYIDHRDGSSGSKINITDDSIIISPEDPQSIDEFIIINLRGYKRVVFNEMV